MFSGDLNAKVSKKEEIILRLEKEKREILLAKEKAGKTQYYRGKAFFKMSPYLLSCPWTQVAKSIEEVENEKERIKENLTRLENEKKVKDK